MTDNLNNKIQITISNMSDILNVHQRTLRIWDKEGILTPERNEKNRRTYSLDDVKKGRLILFLTRNLGMNLNGVKILLETMEMDKVFFKNKMKCVTQAAKNAKIDEVIQKENIKKNLRRGRKTN